MIADYFRLGIKNLRQRKLRSWLTVLGIFIGIAAVVSLVSLGQGLKDSIDLQFQQLGADKIIVSPGGSFFGIGGADLSEADFKAAKKVSGVKLVAGNVYSIVRIEHKRELVYTWLIGLPEDGSREVIRSAQNAGVVQGRDLKPSDNYKVVVGYRFSFDKGLFEKAVKVGDALRINGKNFKVIGIMEEIGNPEDDSQFYLNLGVAREILDKPEGYNFLFIQSKKGYNVSSVADDIKKEIRKVRDEKEGEEDFSVQTSEDIVEGFNTVFTVVNAVLIGLAAISLFVGGVGIMNTMFTAVLQRTNEIGVMKAVGAKNGDIALLFIIESGIIGLVGGIAGVVFGMSIAKLFEFLAGYSGYSFFSAHFPWYLVVGALLFAFIIGVISGLVPALQASKLKPVDALRYE